MREMRGSSLRAARAGRAARGNCEAIIEKEIIESSLLIIKVLARKLPRESSAIKASNASRGALSEEFNPVFRADIGAKMTFDSAHAPTTTPVPGLGRRQLSPRRVTNEPPEREPRSLRETLCTFAGTHR